jgi:hypothetical protein
MRFQMTVDWPACAHMGGTGTPGGVFQSGDNHRTQQRLWSTVADANYGCGYGSIRFRCAATNLSKGADTYRWGGDRPMVKNSKRRQQ